jgi:uroporphyrinogen decarboxylase
LINGENKEQYMSVSKMNHWERMRAAMKGEEVDRAPISLWRHWPVDDETPDGLAAVMVSWQREYDFDLVKFMPTGTYGIEDWGAETIYQPNYRGIRTVTKFGLTRLEQWPELAQLEVTQGYLGRQIEALRLTAEALEDNAPILQTIFSPLTTARKLAGERVFTDLRRNPEPFKAGLQIIAETTARFARASMQAGAHGMFFASQCDTYQLMSEAEYKEFGAHYDLIVMDAVKDAEFNMVHAHGEDIMFDLMASYPAQMINWHDRLTWPRLAQAKERTSGLVVGGVNEWRTLLHGPEEAIAAEVKEAITQTGGRRLLVGPGCVIPGHVPARHVRAAIQAVMG